MPSNDNWYLIYLKPGKNSLFRATDNLVCQGDATFCPCIRIYHPADEKHPQRMTVEPMFRRYLFVCFNPERLTISRVEYCPGVAYIVRIAGEIRPIPVNIVEAIHQLPECKIDVMKMKPEQIKYSSRDEGHGILSPILIDKDESMRSARFIHLIKNYARLPELPAEEIYGKDPNDQKMSLQFSLVRGSD